MTFHLNYKHKVSEVTVRAKRRVGGRGEQQEARENVEEGKEEG